MTFVGVMRDWNPLYVAYARAHGESDPKAMIERDREAYPGGVMAGFMVWVSQRWQEWDAAFEHDAQDRELRTDESIRAFVDWCLVVAEPT